MREDNSNWFGRWEEELPPPEELMPLSQTLITPHLALAFHLHPHHPSTPPPPDFIGGEEPPRTLKRPRLVWTPQLHKRFVDAVAHLGIKNAVPKTIMQLMSVEGLTRENVASHLQKYRLYLRRMQGNAAVRGVHVSDPATDHLFASSPVPAHFLSSPQKYHPQANSFAPSHSRLELQIHGRQRQQYEDSKSGNVNGGREKILTLFPTGND